MSKPSTDRSIVRGERVVLPGGTRPAAIHIRDGRIATVAAYEERPTGAEQIDAGEALVLPGLIDIHVHVNEPGRTAWEGFAHATRAAAAGGVTTLIDMPLNSIPPTTTVTGLAAKLRAAEGQCSVDVGFWGGIVPDNSASLASLAEGGVLGFKAFLSPSGVDEFAHVSEEDLRAALPVAAALGLPVLVHAEAPLLLREPDPAADPRRYTTWLESRPPEAEKAAIEMLTRLSAETGAATHIVHLAAPDAIDAIVKARAAGVRITVETCPHYLTFAAEDIADGATAWKCAPPIRTRADRERLWDALRAGHIDLVATDHSPAPPAMKRLEEGDFVRAWGGVASLQIGLPAVWTGAAARGFPPEAIARVMAEAPAALAGLQERKGRIAAGCDADLLIFEPDAETVVDPAALHHRHPTTPYAGMRLRGRVRRTILRGETVYDGDRIREDRCGRLLLGPRRRC